MATSRIAAILGQGSRRSKLAATRRSHRFILAIAAAASIGAGGAAADDTMTKIVENVRANEALYCNIETVIHKTYKLGRPKILIDDFTKTESRKSRVVLQGELTYLRIDGHSEAVGKASQNLDTLQGYDGLTTRVVEQDAFANIHDGKFTDYRIGHADPYTMQFQRFGIGIPLSTFLQGTPGIRKQKGFEKHNLEVTFEGEEVVDGLRCQKVRCRSWPDSWEGPTDSVGHWDLWLAVDRNYLPIRNELFLGRMKGQAEQIWRYSDLREISPGVWFPMRASLVVYDKLWFNEDHKLVVNNSEEYVVEKAVLDPRYDISLFRDIPIPRTCLYIMFGMGKSISRSRRGSGKSENRAKVGRGRGGGSRRCRFSC